MLSLLPLLILAAATSFAQHGAPMPPRKLQPRQCSPPLPPLNFSECQQNARSLSCAATSTNLNCGAINNKTAPLCPHCNLRCARWIDDMEANLTELASSRLAKECSACQPCYFGKCISTFCRQPNFVNSTMDQPTHQLCLFNLCSGDVGDSDIMNCTEYCGMTESGCGRRPSKICGQAQKKYCSVPGREEQCAVTCAMHDDCGDIVEAILDGENKTMDSFSAALSLTMHHSLPEMPGDCHRPLKSRLNTLNRFHESLQGIRRCSSRYFNEANKRNLAMVYENFLSDDQREEWTSMILETGYGQGLLENIEDAALLFALAGDSFAFQGRSIAMNTRCAAEGLNTYSILRNSSEFSSNATIEVPITHQTHDMQGNCSVAISAAVMRNLDQYLYNESQSNMSGNFTMINTHILTLQVSGRNSFDTSNPVRLIFTPTMIGVFTDVSCVFWDFNISRWSTVNVTTEFNDTHYICSTTHLTSFAVLVTVSGEANEQNSPEDRALSVVSYIGCGVSIVCLILTILVLVFMRKSMKKGSLTYIHLNLCVALLLAIVTFAGGIQAATDVPWLCTVVAALLHYLFLCVFCWMLAEGIMLYLLVVRVFGTAADKWYYLLPLGWGLPVPIVAISVGIRHKMYGNDNFCWLSVDDGVIWAFAAPVLLVILINSFILAITVLSVVRARRSLSKIVTSRLIVTSLKLSIVLLPLLGLTWIFGLLAVNDKTTVFAWLFCIFNSFQGFYVFVLHVMRNEVFQAALKSVCFKRGKIRKKVSSGEDRSAVYGNTQVTPTAITELSDGRFDFSSSPVILTRYSAYSSPDKD